MEVMYNIIRIDINKLVIKVEQVAQLLKLQQLIKITKVKVKQMEASFQNLWNIVL